MSYQPKSYNKFLAGAATAAVVASAVVPVATHAAEKNLTDVKEGSYYAEAVNALAEAGVIKGYEDGTFRPNNQVTRAEVAKIIAVQLGLDTENAGKANYSDAKGHWANTGGYLAAVAKAGIMKGDGNGTFRPNAPLTRAEMASIVVRAYDLQAKEGFESQFKDLNAGGAWAADAIKTLEANGYANGIAKGQFGSASNVKRADVAVFLFRVAKGEAAPTVESVSAINNIEVNEGAETVNLPKEVEVKLSNGEKAQKAVEWDKKGLDLNKPGEYTLTGDVADTDLTASVKVVVKAVDPKVESVSAINAKEVVVTFNKAMNKDSAETVTNYVVTKNTASNVVTDATLSEDGKSVVLQLTDALSDGDVYKVNTVDQAILSAKYEKTSKYEGTNTTFTDKSTPTLLDASYDGTNVELTFSEPINTTTAAPVVKVNGTVVALSATPSDAGDYTYSFTPATTVDGTYNVVVTGATDLVGNEASALTKTFTISSAVSAPSVAGLEAVDTNSFTVKFNQPLNITKANLSLTKGVGNIDPNRVTVTGVVGTEGSVSGTFKEYTVDVNADDVQLPLYGTGESTATLGVKVTGYKNSVGLLGNAYTGSVTLTKDTTAPTIVSQNLVSVNSGKTVVTIPFNDTLVKGTGTVVVKKDSIVQSSLVPTVDVSGKNLTLTFDAELTAGNYTFELGQGVVTDASGNGNAKVSVNYTIAAPTTYLVPTVDDGSNDDANVLTVDFGTPMTDSALSLANYKLDDASLPAGTTIDWIDSKEKVKITLPSSYSVPTDATYKFTVSSAVTAQDGSVVGKTDSVKGDYSENIDLEDNVAPELKSAKFVNIDSVTGLTDEVELTFSEGVVVKDTTDLDDFLVSVVGNDVAVKAIDAKNADTGKVVLTLVTDVNTTQASTIQVVPVGSNNAVANFTDAGANVLKAGSTLSITK